MNRPFVTRIRQAVLALIRTQIEELESDTTDEDDDTVSSELQGPNSDNDGSEDGGEDSDMDDVESDEERQNLYRIANFVLESHDVFDSISERLPTQYKSYKIKIDFEKGYLHIRTVPGLLHSKASTAFQDTIVFGHGMMVQFRLRLCLLSRISLTQVLLSLKNEC